MGGRGSCRILGICAVALGAGILIAAIFPVGALLFLVAFAGSGSFLCACVKRAAKLRVPLLPFALLCVPLALIGADIAEKALMAVLPLRYPIAVLLVGMILIFNAFARKKEGKAA